MRRCLPRGQVCYPLQPLPTTLLVDTTDNGAEYLQKLERGACVKKDSKGEEKEKKNNDKGEEKEVQREKKDAAKSEIVPSYVVV